MLQTNHYTICCGVVLSTWCKQTFINRCWLSFYCFCCCYQISVLNCCCEDILILSSYTFIQFIKLPFTSYSLIQLSSHKLFPFIKLYTSFSISKSQFITNLSSFKLFQFTISCTHNTRNNFKIPSYRQNRGSLRVS